MNVRENLIAVMNYDSYQKMPVVSFGFWTATLRKWRDEGHLKSSEVLDRPMFDHEYDDINTRLGFDFNWNSTTGLNQYILDPPFADVILETLPDGKTRKRDEEGNIIICNPGKDAVSMCTEHTLVDRESWKKHYLPRLNPLKISFGETLMANDKAKSKELPAGLFCGSIVGRLRNWLGLENFIYLWYDDPGFFIEMVDAIGEYIFSWLEKILKTGQKYDYALFWEDICGNDGPLAPLEVMENVAGPHYKRITELLSQYGINIVSLDCDGKIDALVPVWLKNGVNTMFPIEIGYWNANIKNWRAAYGRQVRGVGGVDKKIFAMDRKAIDMEIERIKPLVESGGYVPCPDHRIPPDSTWENVQYYCDKFRNIFAR